MSLRGGEVVLLNYQLAMNLLLRKESLRLILKPRPPKDKLFSQVCSIASSETQGQLVRAGKSLNGREKNSGAEKSRTTRRAPGDKVLTDQFQAAGVVLASNWCHKTFVFCAQSQSGKTRSRFAYPYTIGCSPYVYLRRKVQSQHKM